MQSAYRGLMGRRVYGKYNTKAKREQMHRVYGKATVVWHFYMPPPSFKPVALSFCHVSPSISKPPKTSLFF